VTRLCRGNPSHDNDLPAVLLCLWNVRNYFGQPQQHCLELTLGERARDIVNFPPVAAPLI